MPRQIAPMLATAGALPTGPEDEWAFEIKWDGVRVLSYARGGEVRLESRNLADITPRYPEVHPLASTVGVDVILDGEVVAFGEDGKPSFQTLQHRMHVTGTAEVSKLMVEVPVLYIVFDVLWVNGQDTTGLPFGDRRRLLESLELSGPAWRLGTSQIGGGPELSQLTREQGLEGVVAKRLDSRYEPGRRSRSWVKIKNTERQEVVIGGWIGGDGNRRGRIGALVLGHYDESGLRFTGKVGTGFSNKSLSDLTEQFRPLARATSPFFDEVPWGDVHWLEPQLVAEVEFTEWTRDGTLRHPSFKGLRTDKRPGDVRRERRATR